MAFMLYTTENPIDREQRKRINLNWEMITNRFSNLQGQVSVLAGGEDVEKLIIRINDSIEGAVKAKEDADKATADARTAIDDINTTKAETEAATVAANEATNRANEASETVQLQINELNEKLPELTQQLQDGDKLKTDLESLQTDLTTLQTDLNTAKENTERATADAIEAYNQIKGWGAATVWSNVVPYEKNNVVTHNGSSWQATTPNVNSQPSVDNSNWLVLARAGLDGLGSVVTVNNQSPDMNGNVQITKGDIGLGNVENYLIATTDEAIEGTTDEAYMTPLKTKESIEKGLELVINENDVETTALTRGDNQIEAKINTQLKVTGMTGKTDINLIPPFTSSAWNINVNAVVNSPTKLTLNATAIGQASHVLFPIKGGETYTLAYNSSNPSIAYVNGEVLDSSGNLVEYTPQNENGQTVTMKPEAAYVKILVTCLEGGTFTFENITFKTNSTNKNYVSGVQGITNPTIVNETNNTYMTLPVTLQEGETLEIDEEGNLVANRIYGYKEITSDIPFELVGQSGLNSEAKTIRTSLSNIGDVFSQSLFENDARLINFDGRLFEERTSGTSFSFDVANNGTWLNISIPNEVTGWGVNYAPTQEDLKAFLDGWLMYDVDSAVNGQIVPYNGVGEKIWAIRNTPLSGYEDSVGVDKKLVIGTGIRQVPTVTPSGFGFPNTTWKPITIVYKLAVPRKEIIIPYGDLTLVKGTNSLNVYEGRMVNEYVKARVGGGNNLFINQDGFNETRLKYRNERILNIYSNGVKDLVWEIRDNDAYGNQRAVAFSGTFNPLDTYSVDYEPLYKWEVTTLLESIQIEYYSTLEKSAKENINTEIATRNILVRANSNKVQKEAPVIYIKPTLNSGLGFLAGEHLNSYYKDASGEVFINLFLEGVPTTSGRLVFRLPQGYRPKGSITFPTFHYAGSGGLTAGITTVFENGEVAFQNGEAINRQYHVLNVSFKAEN